MSESIIQADIQRELLRLTSTFSAGDVVISDRSILDGSTQNAPYAIIDTAGNFDTENIETEWSITWQIPIWLYVAFDDWDSSLIAIRNLRDTVITALRNTMYYDPLSFTLGWGLRKISGSEIGWDYGKYNENPTEAQPIFCIQLLTLTVEETSGG